MNVNFVPYVIKVTSEEDYELLINLAVYRLNYDKKHLNSALYHIYANIFEIYIFLELDNEISMTRSNSEGKYIIKVCNNEGYKYFDSVKDFESYVERLNNAKF